MNTKQAAEFLGCSTRTIRRYISSGKLPVKRHGNDVKITKKDLMGVGSKILENKEIYVTPELKKEPEEPISPRELIFEMKEKPEDMLNEIGKGELMRVTKAIEEAGLLEITDPMLIMKYALCQQMYFKYLSICDSSTDIENVVNNNQISPFFRMMEAYQKQVTFYEKELGLTTASRSRLKTPDQKNEVDPMEAILNGE